MRNIVAGRVELVLRDGVAFDDVAAAADVRFGARYAAVRLDGGTVDQVVRGFSHGFRVVRGHVSRTGRGRVGSGHLGWDDLEHQIGLSRTFELECDPTADVDALVDALRGLDVVEQASPHYLCETPFAVASTPSKRSRSAFDQIGAAEALAIEAGDPTVIVAIVDSGVAVDHPELLGRVRAGADTVDLVQDLLDRGLVFAGPRRDLLDVRDDLGHGTGCAGIVAALGVELHPGVGGCAQILPLRALAKADRPDRPQPTAMGSIPDINAAVKLAVDLGAKVLNLSFGTPAADLRRDDPLPHAAILQYALARGVIPIAASGNRGDTTRYYPACLPGVIAVGSCDPSGLPSQFSTRGDHVAICAPGERIPCAAIDGYRDNTGTSFAAPFVAGAVALLVARGRRQALPLESDRVRDILRRSARPFPNRADARGCGAGVLDLPAALRLLDETGRGPPDLRLFTGLPPPAATPTVHHATKPVGASP